jgi:hypothetical protein
MSTAISSKPASAPIAVARQAPRRRSLAQGALAVLLIVSGALTAGYVVLRMGSTHDFLAVSRPVAARTEITLADLTVVRVNEAVGIDPIPAGKINQVVGKRAVMALVPGTLLTAAQLTANAVPAPGKQLVGLGLEEDQMPRVRLKPGARVLLVVLPEENAANDPNAPSVDLVPPPTIEGIVVDIAPQEGGDTLVNVEVDAGSAATVASLSAQDRIVVTLVGA